MRSVLRNGIAIRVVLLKPFAEISLVDHKPAPLNQKATLEWRQIPMSAVTSDGDLSAGLLNCHVAQSFRREHPELVVIEPDRRSPVAVKSETADIELSPAKCLRGFATAHGDKPPAYRCMLSINLRLRRRLRGVASRLNLVPCRKGRAFPPCAAA